MKTRRRQAARISDDELIARAKQARKLAYAPYSKFKVGAAVLTADGRVFTGCNVENSTYSLAMCAERVAILKAISEGASSLLKLAIVGDPKRLTPPCGCCRQMIREFASDKAEVILANLSGGAQKLSIKQLLPEAFNSTFLTKTRR
jgi:cytidine deaminase